VALAALLPMAFALPGQAAFTDQPDAQATIAPILPRSYQTGLSDLAQTFTATVTGQVDRVALQADTPTRFAGATVTIVHLAADGTPDDTRPAGQASGISGALSCCKLFHDVVFSPMVPVTAGTQYAIRVSVWGGTLTWYDSATTDVYAGGRQLILMGSTWTPAHPDFLFTEYVATGVSANPAPTVTAAKGAVSAPEGTALTNTGTFSDTDGDTVTISATTGKVTQTGTTSGTWSWSQPAVDESSATVTITADDGHGMKTSTGFTAQVTNVAPKATINSATPTLQLVLTPQETVNFTGSFTDVDSGDSYITSWDFGDGTPAESGTTPSHAYAAAGTYTVTFSVNDKEGGIGTATRTVTVQTVPAALSAIAQAVQGLNGLNAGQKNSLIAKLNAASDSTARGDYKTADNQLNAFLNELQADVSSGKVTSGQATVLRDAVHAVQGALGTFNRFLEWWPLVP
jgi:hypothetical protein